MATDRVCSTCGLQTLRLFPKQGRWRCANEDCGDDFPVEAEATGGGRAPGLAGLDLECLPSVIAIPLGEYASERDPLLGLWRICDTVELTLRLAVAIGIAEVLRANKQKLPAKLRETLAEEIEEPTLGGWRAMAREIAKHVPEGAVVPEIAGFVSGSLEPLLRGPEAPKDRTPGNSLASLRNQLAHGGGVTRSVAAKLLVLHAPRFEEVMRACVWLGEIELVTPRQDCLPGVLGGPHPGLRTFRPASDAVLLEVQRASQSGDAVVLVRGTRVLSLWPFTVYGLPASSNPDALPARNEVPQVYSRRGLVRLQLTPVGSLELAQSEATDEALRLFEALFRRDEKAPTTKWRVAGWESSLRRDSKKLVGRTGEIAALRKAIDETQTGVLWLTGPAGIGKSTIIARVACDLVDDATSTEVILPFRFMVGDGRCSQAAFLEFAIERLRAAAGAAADGEEGRSGKKRPLDELRDLLSQAKRRVVFLLDGLDEIAASDTDFAGKVPLGLAGPNVVWMCAGRSERGLTEAFSPGRCRHVFGGGLPRMSAKDIRDMLMRRLDFLAKELARSDRDEGGKVENPFVSAVEKNAEGLPIYVEYVIGDVCTRRIQVLDERARLPASLAAYHEELLKRCQVGSLQMVLTPLICLLAVAYEPLSDRMLHRILSGWLRIAAEQDGLNRVRQALTAVSCVLKRASTTSGDAAYTLFHDSLRAHMERSESTRAAITDTRGVMADLALRWEALPKDTPLVDYLARWGLAHCVAAGRGNEAPDLAVALARTGSPAFIKALVAAIYDLAPNARHTVEAILIRLKTDRTFGARYACLMYYTWRLPTPIALSLDRSDQVEPHPVLFAWFVVDVVAAAMQFIGILTLADCLTQATPPRDAGYKLPDLRNPTLGSWAAAPRQYYRACAARGLPVVFDFLQRLFCEEREDIEQACRGLVSFRNRLAYGGGLAKKDLFGRLPLGDISQLLDTYFDAILVLSNGQLLLFDERVDARRCRFRVLLGPDVSSAEMVQVDCTLSLAPRQLLFRMGESLVVLPPMLLCEAPAAGRLNFLMFQRYREGTCNYFDLTSNQPVEVAAEDSGLARVWDWLEDTGTAEDRVWAVNGFERDLRRIAARCAGREAELSQVENALTETGAGVLWLWGPPGIGKSILMAKTACKALDARRENTLVLPFLFRAADARCSRAAFARFSCERLRSWLSCERESVLGGERSESVEELRFLLSRIGERRVVFLLDGLDEIESQDERFAADFPLGLPAPGVVWLCCGRTTRSLGTIFSDGQCIHIFPDGVPRMSTSAIREQVLQYMGPLSKRLARMDVVSTEAEVQNRFIEEVVRMSEGWPVYVSFLVAEFLSGRIQRLEEARLVPSLASYLQNLVDRTTFGDLNQVLAPMFGLLAVAQESLTAPVIHALLARSKVVPVDTEGTELVAKALVSASASLCIVANAGGANTYALFHSSLRLHLQMSELTSHLAAAGRESLAQATLEWTDPMLEPARGYLWRYGSLHLCELDRGQDAQRLLLDPSFAEGVCRGVGPMTLAEQCNNVAGALGSDHLRACMLRRVAEAIRVQADTLTLAPERVRWVVLESGVHKSD